MPRAPETAPVDEATPESPETLRPVRLSLVLPAFNEAEGIVAAVEEADAMLSEIVDEHEVLVVDDGSRDDTALRVEAILPVHPAVRLLRHEGNRGYGAALRTGFAAARMPLVAYTDADRQFDLRDLLRSLEALEGHDLVTCYRRDRKDSALRCAYSRAFNLLARLLLGFKVRDCDCSLKLFRRETLMALHLSESGFLIDSEILARAHRIGASMAEIGVTHRPRAAGQSTVSVWHALPVLTGIVRLRSQLRREGETRRPKTDDPGAAGATDPLDAS